MAKHTYRRFKRPYDINDLRREMLYGMWVLGFLQVIALIVLFAST
jgi:hypothetical protein